jgi:hypothetical protein
VAITPSPYKLQHGLLVYISLSISGATAGGGYVQVYADNAYTDLVAEKHFEISESVSLASNEPRRFYADTANGTLYFTVYNSTDNAITVDITAEATVLIAGTPSYSDVTPLGQGLEGDGTGATRLALANSGGLEFSSDDVRVKVNSGASVKVARKSTGLEVENAIARSGVDQVIPSTCRFGPSSVSITRSMSSVPPSTGGVGTYDVGHLFRTIYGELYECYDDTPSALKWRMLSTRHKTQTQKVYNVTPGGSATSSLLAMRGRRGMILQANIWAFNASSNTRNFDSTFRFACYPNENYEERERLFQVIGQMRGTHLTADVASGGTLTIDDVGLFDLGSLCRVYRLTQTTQEYQRVSGRSPSTDQLSIYDSIDAPMYNGDVIVTVTEVRAVPWWNDSTTDPDALYWKVWNQGSIDQMDFWVDWKVTASGWDDA